MQYVSAAVSICMYATANLSDANEGDDSILCTANGKSGFFFLNWLQDELETQLARTLDTVAEKSALFKASEGRSRAEAFKCEWFIFSKGAIIVDIDCF